VPGRDLLLISLAISVLGLLCGPALASLGRGRPGVTAGLDGLALGVVPAVLGLHLVPHVYQSLGPVALALLLAGYLAVWLSDRHQHKVASRSGGSFVFWALMVHALTDGASLAAAAGAAERAGGFGLALFAALLVHRLPEGLFLSTTLQPQVGTRGVWLRLAALAGATAFGALGGDALMRLLPDALFDGVVALGLGAMLRLVMHSHAPPARGPLDYAVTSLAFLGGLALVLAIPAIHHGPAAPVELPAVRWIGTAIAAAAPLLRVVGWIRRRHRPGGGDPHDHPHAHDHPHGHSHPHGH